MAKEITIGNGILVTLGKENLVIPRGAVLIRDGVIAAVGTDAEVRKQAPEAEYVDAAGKVIMPGLINAHHHLYSTFARGMAPKDPPPYTFVEVLERLWWPLDAALVEGDLYYAAMLPLIDCIKQGTTSIIDHHESQGYQIGSLSELAKAVDDSGIRGCLCLGISDRYGRGAEGIEENVRFVKEANSVPATAARRVCGMFGLHAAFTVEDETLAAAVSAADRLGVGFHTHVAEAASDEEASLVRYGQRVLRRLRDKGALGEKSLAIHCVHIDGEETDILLETGTAAVHNPESNMNNAVGVAPVLEMFGRGIAVGLGTDGMTSDMRSGVKTAFFLQHLAQEDPRVGFCESCSLLLDNNPEIVSRQFGYRVGVLAPGAAGDVIVVDYTAPTPLDGNTWLGHFLFGICCGAAVDTTVVGGKVLMRGKKLTLLDEEALAARCRERARAFYGRF
ncbi:MAG TPA: putative aminohydrolase SsnA [bacterium]|nr:putative aminohydrolase SsnA [bacterium]HPQ66462.1 putative aminohydrolase SsnA [bacterium]